MVMPRKPVYGVGINDLSKWVTQVNGRKTKLYSKWVNMLERCYSAKLHARNPTYIGCEVCDEWKVLSGFKEWFDTNYIEGYDLDKDIIKFDNKLYCPELCVFVPSDVNTFCTAQKLNNNGLPIGISCDKRNGKFRADICSVNGRLYSLTTPSIAQATADALALKRQALANLLIKYPDLNQRVVAGLHRYVEEVFAVHNQKVLDGLLTKESTNV